MTLRQFFMEYLWPMDTYSVSRSTEDMQDIDLKKDTSAERIEKANAAADTAKRQIYDHGVRLQMQLQLRPNLQTYVRRWFMLSVGLFALAWASSLVLTLLGSLAAMMGLGLLGIRHYVERRDAADKTSDAYGTFRTPTDDGAEIHRSNLH